MSPDCAGQDFAEAGSAAEISTLRNFSSDGWRHEYLLFAPGRWQVRSPPEPGRFINTEFDEYEPLIAPDKAYLIFMAAGRPDSHSRSNDLYISRQQNGAWTPARNMGDEINSHREEYSPALSPDGKYFFFSSTRMRTSPPRPLSYEAPVRWLRGPGNGLGDIYQVDLAQILSR